MDRPGVRTPLVHDPVGLRRRAAVHLVDLGRRLDEGNLVGESHQGQADRLGLLDHGLRHGVEHAPDQFHDEDGRVRVREPPDEG